MSRAVSAVVRPASQPQLEDLVFGLPADAGHRIRFEPTDKRVRPFVAGTAVADSTRARIMLETGRLPVYYFPTEDVRTDLLTTGLRELTSPHKGDGAYWSIRAGGRLVEDAAWRYPDPPAGCPDISGYVAFHWQRMDAWYEEDEEVFGHPHDPHHRIDILESSRHVRVRAGGRLVADTRRPRLLFETGLPTRYYIPRLDVRLDLLEPSSLRTTCAYKGTTTGYWAVRGDDGSPREVAWSYAAPAPECAKIANLVCFFNERVDIAVDGVELPRPEGLELSGVLPDAWSQPSRGRGTGPIGGRARRPA